jgi:hypothetical protein
VFDKPRGIDYDQISMAIKEISSHSEARISKGWRKTPIATAKPAKDRGLRKEKEHV